MAGPAQWGRHLPSVPGLRGKLLPHRPGAAPRWRGDGGRPARSAFGRRPGV